MLSLLQSDLAHMQKKKEEEKVRLCVLFMQQFRLLVHPCCPSLRLSDVTVQGGAVVISHDWGGCAFAKEMDALWCRWDDVLLRT